LPGATSAAEEFRELLNRSGLRIERIVSTGQASPAGFWYDEPRAEWVVVLQGEAKLEFENEGELLLKAGDFVDIAPRRRHRVAWTDANGPTIWLAIHYVEL
jgi:cupin 2 domain-containing protein